MKFFVSVAFVLLLTFTAEAKPAADLMVNGERDLEAAQHFSRCGAAGGGKVCILDSCCSKESYCFFGDAWCGNGCQPNYGKCLQRCGSGYGNSCPLGYCCSRYGWCGNGDAWCGAGCQPGYGRCDQVTVNNARVMDDFTPNADGDIENDEKQAGRYHEKLEKVPLEVVYEVFGALPASN